MRKRIGFAIAAASVLALAATGHAETPVEKRLRMLEQQLKEAQDKIKRLEQQADQQRAIGQATQKQVEQNAEEAKTAAAESHKKVASLPDWLNHVTPFGDVRYRTEGFYHQPHQPGQDVTAETRERIRARVGLRVGWGEELSSTIRLATGNPNDPISTNQTLTGNFTRKNINLDWAFLTFTPGKTFGIRPGLASITGGKFPNPIFRTDEMVFDDDLSLEGLSEQFQLLGKPYGVLDQVKLHGLQWTFDEISNQQDGWMFGGQANPSFHFGDLQLEAGLGQYWWLNSDQIAQALSQNTTAFTASGAPVANPNFNSSLYNTNLLMKQTVQPPTTTPGKKPAAFTAITGYRSGFNQSGLTLAATLPNVVAAQPLRFWADYIYNWLAVNDEAQGVTAGLRLGQLKTRGDWALTGFYEYFEQESAISSFAWSDFGNGGTNLKGPGVGLDYQLLDPLTLSARANFTNFITKPAGVTTGDNNPTQTRLQLDAQVKF